MSHVAAYSGKQDPINCPANQPKNGANPESLDDEITEEEMDARRGASQPWCSKCECYEEDCTCLWDEDELQRQHMRKMVEHAADVAGCEHKYAEQETAPLGVRCLRCGHFVGAWQ